MAISSADFLAQILKNPLNGVSKDSRNGINPDEMGAWRKQMGDIMNGKVPSSQSSAPESAPEPEREQQAAPALPAQMAAPAAAPVAEAPKGPSANQMMDEILARPATAPGKSGSGLVGENGEGSWIAGMAKATQPIAFDKLRVGTQVMNEALDRGEAFVGKSSDEAYAKVAETANEFTPDFLQGFMAKKAGQQGASLSGSEQYDEDVEAWQKKQDDAKKQSDNNKSSGNASVSQSYRDSVLSRLQQQMTYS